MNREPLTCRLCGATSHDVTVGLVRWRDTTPEFDRIPRCRSTSDCYDRVQEQGEVWPVADRRPSREAAA